MAHIVIMPRQGQSVESCALGKWHKKKGDSVAAGDLLFTYETDKAAFEEYAKESGTLLEIFYDEGDDVPCLADVCAIGREGEEAAVSASAVRKDELKVSPRAKSLAARAGADPSEAVPTGPGGRVTARDVEELIKNAAVRTSAAPIASVASAAPVEKERPESELVAHSGVRRAIAKAMSASLADAAQLTLHSSFDATEILGLRAKVKEKRDALGLPDATVGDMILFAVSRCLLKHRELNAHYEDAGLRVFKNVNLGVAVDTARGLLVPTLFGAERMGLGQISSEVRRLAAACRDGSIRAGEMSGGTFTVTNLGALGVESFTPIINPPQTAILGVCAAVMRPGGAAAADAAAYPAIGLSLTFDHRAVDGAPAARFLAELVKDLENFTLTSTLICTT